MNRLAPAGMMVCLLVLSACSSRPPSDPATPAIPAIPQLPDTSLSSPQRLEMVAPGHSLLGYFCVTIDAASGEATVVPLRAAAWHLNALKFLEPESGGSLISLSNLSLTGRKVDVDVTIRHPFPGLPHYCGFDVKGIVIGCADTFDRTEPSRIWAGGSNGLRVLNADGWTRWWNPTEFPDNGTVFSYHDGKLGTIAVAGSFDATLCGYKVFAASLDRDDPITHLLAFPLDHPNGRATFHSSGSETRRYELVFPGKPSGEPDLTFNYAVDACHGFPDGYVPGEYIEVPDGFPPDANQLEPFIVDINVLKNSVYLSPEGCVGGTLKLSIRVSDWQALLAGTPVSHEVESIELTSPTLFLAGRTPVLVADSTTDTPWATYEITLKGLSPDSLFNQQILVTVVSSEGDYQTHVSSYSGAAPLSSFYVVRVPVSEAGAVGGAGFALNPLAPWPKPGGTNHNSYTTGAVGPANPEIAWEIDDLSLAGQPVVDAEGRVFVSRRIDTGGVTLLVLDPDGLPLAELDFPDFEPAGNPMLVGCSLLWNDYDGNVIQLFPDGSHLTLFSPVSGPGPQAYGMLNIDDDGHAFVHGPSSIQAFDEYGNVLWCRYGIDGAPSMFIGPPTVAGDGTVVVGKVDLDITPPGNFEFWGLAPTSGEILWTHKPGISDVVANGSSADPLTGQMYYAVTNHIVALSGGGVERWTHQGDHYYLPSIAVGPSGTVYGAETLLGQSGGSSSLVALSHLGEFLWSYDCKNSIVAGPIVDSADFVYFATDEAEIYSLYPDGSLRWKRDLDGRAAYLTMGPEYSLLVGFRETMFTTSVTCLKDMG